MPETRHVDEYDNQGNIIHRIPYEVSDKELHQEQLDAEFNDKLHQGLSAYNNWDSLNPPQKDIVLRNILGFILYKEGML